ncbi:MAG TPA: transglycosylase SLT domain-containing protein [Candidatus Paceibacterota bacterium]|nr:transglycosylase SLT domain-containing protein [Candidatus Paceibacterota bacterium]
MSKFFRPKTKPRLSAIILVAVLLIFAVPVFAHAASWWPIVPCGLQHQPSVNGVPIPTSVHDYTQPCNQCDVILLFKNMIDFVEFWVVPIVGTFFFILAGFLILLGGGRGKPAQVTQGFSIMRSTVIGIAIILASWLIANTFLKTLAAPTAIPGPWYQIQCSTGSLQSAVDATIPHPATGSNSNGTGNTTGGNSNGNTNPSEGNNNNATGGTSGASVSGTLPNLCAGQAPSSGCGTAAACSKYDSYIEKYASGPVTANLLKAIMVIESHCNPSTSNSAGKSYGLMELQVSTAQTYSQYCGVSKNTITSSWLTDPANAEKEICLASKYMQQLVVAGCGNNPADIAANYNGNNACVPSKDCQGMASSCNNNPVQSWECLWDDAAHTEANTGFNETRNYVPNVLYCMNNITF